jgi:hypothetical protein
VLDNPSTATSLACSLEFPRQMPYARLKQNAAPSEGNDDGHEQGKSDCTRPERKSERSLKTPTVRGPSP